MQSPFFHRSPAEEAIRFRMRWDVEPLIRPENLLQVLRSNLDTPSFKISPVYRWRGLILTEGITDA